MNKFIMSNRLTHVAQADPMTNYPPYLPGTLSEIRDKFLTLTYVNVRELKVDHFNG